MTDKAYIASTDAYPMYFSNTCDNCKHLENSFLRTCKAFPDGIPEAIWLDENNHTQPFEGDNGIRFEAITD